MEESDPRWASGATRVWQAQQKGAPGCTSQRPPLRRDPGSIAGFFVGKKKNPTGTTKKMTWRATAWEKTLAPQLSPRRRGTGTQEELGTQRPRGKKPICSPGKRSAEFRKEGVHVATLGALPARGGASRSRGAGAGGACGACECRKAEAGTERQHGRRSPARCRQDPAKGQPLWETGGRRLESGAFTTHHLQGPAQQI